MTILAPSSKNVDPAEAPPPLCSHRYPCHEHRPRDHQSLFLAYIFTPSFCSILADIHTHHEPKTFH